VSNSPCNATDPSGNSGWIGCAVGAAAFLLYDHFSGRKPTLLRALEGCLFGAGIGAGLRALGPLLRTLGRRLPPRIPPIPRPNLNAAKPPLWTSTKTKTAAENAFRHWKKHRPEFPEFQNAKQYVEGAKKFFSDPPPHTLTKTRPTGDKLFYNPASNTFGVQAPNGAPRTMFRPTDGIRYWFNQ
ncbi:MAG TPA: hypothetical protein VFM05_08735, partial [Candidatus Saccharimonadales bacterium]|nr:hypothetical protein [Candidatus Saccharimonadales bacterium]